MRELITTEAESRHSGFLMGMLCGAAVGAAVGLLLAPKAGSELRQQLYESTGRLRETAVKGFETVVERGKMAAQQGQETYENIRTAAANGAHNVAKAATERL